MRNLWKQPWHFLQDWVSLRSRKSWHRDNEEGGYSGAMTSAAETMAAFSKQTYVSPYFIAQVYALAGDKEKTIEWLERGYEMKDPMMPYVGGFTYDLLDDDPRYQNLLRRMNLPEGK